MDLAFIGSKELGFECLKSLIEKGFHIPFVITLNDSKDTRSCFEEFKLISKENGIKFIVDADEESLKDNIKLHSIKTILVCNWYKIISKSVIEILENGIYGIHNSLLPKYRGMSPLIWSALSDDDYIGSSLFKFDQGMDTGDIAKQWKLKNEGLYIKEIIDKLSELIVKDLPMTMNNILNNEIKHSKQNNAEATYCNKRNPEDSKLCWNKLTSKEAMKHIRILNEPYPYNFSILDHKKVVILKARPFNSPIYGIPGSLFQLEGETIVCCLDGKGIILEEVADEFGKNIALTSLKGRFNN